MMRFLADENFNSRIFKGLKKRVPDLDIVRVQDVGLTGSDDPTILEWAARENRILLTHDFETMVKFAYERIEANLPVAGVFEIHEAIPVGTAIEELVLIIGASEPEEWRNRVEFLPLK